MSLILELSHQLSDYLRVGLTSKGDITEVFALDLRMIIDYSIVNDEYFLVLVIVRVTVSFADFTASGPSGMGNSNCGANGLFSELIDQSLYAIETRYIISFLREFP
jgi:hypothetical protein